MRRFGERNWLRIGGSARRLRSSNRDHLARAVVTRRISNDVVEVEVSAGEHSTGRLRNSVAATDGTFPEVGAMPRVDEATRQAAYSRPVGDVR